MQQPTEARNMHARAKPAANKNRKTEWQIAEHIRVKINRIHVGEVQPGILVS